MHLKRWLSAIVILPVLIFAILHGRASFSIFVLLASFITLREYFRIVYNNTDRPLFSLLPIIGFIICLLIMSAAHFELFHHVPFIIVINILTIGWQEFSNSRMIPISSMPQQNRSRELYMFRFFCPMQFYYGAILMAQHGFFSSCFLFFSEISARFMPDHILGAPNFALP